jgi:hypothetical protein
MVKQKKKVADALRKAKNVEKHKLLTKKESVAVFKEGLSLGERLRKLLSSSWFVKDLDQKKRK